MFAYCSNNPVMGYDPSGQGWLEDWWDDTVDEAEKIWNAVSTTVVNSWNATKEFAADVWNDLDSISFNPYNSDESDVLESKYVSFYKGSLVIRYSNPNIASFGAFGMIVLDRNVNDTTTVKHEWGHNVQEKVMGTPGYLLYVGLPSAIYCEWGDYKNYHDAVRKKMYFSKIWERTADWLGGVNRNNYDSFWTLDNFLCW